MSSNSLSRKLLNHLKCEPMTILVAVGVMDSFAVRPMASPWNISAANVLNLRKRLDFLRNGSTTATFSVDRDYI
jgi:hypothetical protein